MAKKNPTPTASRRRPKGEGGIVHRSDVPTRMPQQPPSRRPKGDGSFPKKARADGRWAFVVDLGTDETGRRKRRTLYAKSRAALVQRVQDERARQGGSIKGLAVGTVGEYLDDWLTTEEPGWAASTFALYDGMLRKHVLPIASGTKLERLDTDAVKRLYERMRANGATPSVMNSCARILRAAFQVREDEKGVPNPFRLAKVPKYQPPAPEALRVEIARSFLKAAKSSAIESLFVIGLCAGVRPQELLAIKWTDFDESKRTLDIRRQLRDVKGHVSVVPTKTLLSRRTLPLNNLAMTALKRRRAIAKNEGHGSEYVHTGPKGAFLRPSYVRRVYLKPILVAAGIEHATVRQLRKSFSTLLANDGVSPGTNSDLMGHAKRSTAIEHYQQGDAASNRAAVDRLNAVLTGRTKRPGGAKPQNRSSFRLSGRQAKGGD